MRPIAYLLCVAVFLAGCAGSAEPTAEPSTTGEAPPSKPEVAAPDVGRRHDRVAVLMYHVIGDPRPGAPYPELFVSRTDFDGQMRWLAKAGYTAVTLRDVWDHWQGRRALPERPIVITFDDGSRGIVERAAPILATHHWPGVLNLDLSNIDASEGFGERRVRRLVAAGWEVDSHTLTHPDLTTLDDSALRREVAGSRAAIQRRFGVPAEFFCYPAGRFDERVIAAVRAAGYLGATTTIHGLADSRDPYRLARVRVNRSDDVDGFGRKLTELGPWR